MSGGLLVVDRINKLGFCGGRVRRAREGSDELSVFDIVILRGYSNDGIARFAGRD